MIKTILICALIISLFSFSGNDWKPGKTDTKGNLIIVEMQNRSDVKDRPIHEIISVDTDWSILIRYTDTIEQNYYIFNNIKKQIFNTTSFDRFIKEVHTIPNRTNIRKIEKCSAPFDYLMPQELVKRLNKTIEKKNCVLEPKLMFCYCLSEKLTYPFLK